MFTTMEDAWNTLINIPMKFWIFCFICLAASFAASRNNVTPPKPPSTGDPDATSEYNSDVRRVRPED